VRVTPPPRCGFDNTSARGGVYQCGGGVTLTWGGDREIVRYSSV